MSQCSYVEMSLKYANTAFNMKIMATFKLTFIMKHPVCSEEVRGEGWLLTTG